MTDELAPKPAKKPRGKAFKVGYDPRRWMNGRGVKSPEQKEGEQILLAVIWEELSREFDTGTMKPLEQSETIDAMRLMVRSWIKKRPDLIADRIAGKVTEKHEVKSEVVAEIGVKLIDYRAGIAQTENRPSADSDTSSQDKSLGDGA